MKKRNLLQITTAAFFAVAAISSLVVGSHTKGEIVRAEEPTRAVTPSQFEKVTSADDLVSGTYLIVYETSSYVFNGSLTSLDGTGNYQTVTISNNTIAYNETT